MCTRVFNNSSNDFLTTARNLDWHSALPTSLYCFNKGLNKTGTAKITNKTLTWESQYASVVNMVGQGDSLIASEGMNSEGLVANALMDTKASYHSNYASFDKQLDVARWVQYVLDTCKYVSEAVDKFADDSAVKIQLLSNNMPGSKDDALMQLAVSDIYGDSAIIEVANGIFNVFHSDNFKVMTNQPDYETQILLNMTARWQWGDDNPFPAQTIPGGPFPSERFQRASFYLNNLEEAYSMQESIAQTRAIVNTTAVPTGLKLAKKSDQEVMQTQWSSISDHNHQTYYFNNHHTQETCYCALADVNFIDDVLRFSLVEEIDGMLKQQANAGLVNHKFKAASDPFLARENILDNQCIA